MFNEHAIPLETLSNADSTSGDGSRKSSSSSSSSNTRRRNSGDDDDDGSDDERSKGTFFSSYLSSNNINRTVSSNTTIKKEDDLRLKLLSMDKQVERYNQLVSSIIPEIDMIQVQEIISIGSIITNDNDTTKVRNIHCHAFVYQDTMLMTLPDIMSQKSMDHSKFYSCVSELIEIAETIQCESLVIAINKNSKKSNIVLRALLYIGFQLVDPFIYKQDPIYILVGYEL
ncbi:hypothetical protein INT45_000468 [Circinella minor]|uniref:Ornithine decarboxylase antizyme n=1 Tax=Circinella minor TaxID=1195481 RepID=A0A8H7S7F4_9FUNG|nr:hypothetical protein INT45_000468 [Circinella minor]